MPAIIRSTLEPYLRKDRKKWYPRGTYPIRLEDGTIDRKTGYKGTGSDTRAACQEECDRLNRDLEREALSEDAITFETAAEMFLDKGGDGRFLDDRLLDRIGDWPCDAITDELVTKVARELYPTAAPATLNRQLYTPIISVLRLASRGKDWKPSIQRPKGYWRLKPAKVPPDPWFAKVKPHCRPQLWALVAFCTTSSRRGIEAMRCLPSDYSPEDKTIYVGKDKRGNPILVPVGEQVVEALNAYNWQAGPGLFGHYVPKNRRNLFRDLKAACERAGVAYFTPHKAGRHAFAKRFLKAGYSLAHLMGAGGWDQARIPAELYGHFEFSEVAEDAKKVGEEFLGQLDDMKDNVVELKRKRRRA